MKYTVLIAEDNELLRNMLKDVLEGWDYNILTATDGHSCLETARREQPDLILLDVMFPGLSGYEVCAALKQSAETRSIAVVIMTVLLDTESRIHGYGVGADNFLIKPIKYDELKAIIQNLLSKKLYRDTLEEGGSVVRVLQSFSRLLAVQTAEADAFRMKYCNKLLESLGWDTVIAERTRTALMFPSPAKLAEQTGMTADKFLDLTDNLRMGHYLKPMLQFLNAPKNNTRQFRSILKERNCLEAAELVLIVNRYTELFYKEKNREKALVVLNRESDEYRYNPIVLKKLEEILQAERFLEDIQKNLQ